MTAARDLEGTLRRTLRAAPPAPSARLPFQGAYPGTKPHRVAKRARETLFQETRS